jgi:hypothetical protein
MDPATISIPGIGCMTRKFLSYRVSRDQFSTMLVAVDLSGSDNHQLDLDRLHHWNIVFEAPWGCETTMPLQALRGRGAVEEMR